MSTLFLKFQLYSNSCSHHLFYISLPLCASSSPPRTQLDGHVVVRRSRGLLCCVRRPADVPALSSVLPRRAAAQRSSQRRGRGQPAALAGPDQPQSAAARTLSGYGVEMRAWPFDASPVFPLFSLEFCLKVTGW